MKSGGGANPTPVHLVVDWFSIPEEGIVAVFEQEGQLEQVGNHWVATEREAWLEAVTNDPLLPGRILPPDYLGQQAWRRRGEVLRVASRQPRTFQRPRPHDERLAPLQPRAVMAIQASFPKWGVHLSAVTPKVVAFRWELSHAAIANPLELDGFSMFLDVTALRWTSPFPNQRFGNV